MSHPIPVDIISDSDQESGDNRRQDLGDDPIDLVTPPRFTLCKKKVKSQVVLNPCDSTVFVIDDDPTPCKRSKSSEGSKCSATPSFVAETPFSDASTAGCSRGKFSSSGDGSATQKLVVPDTPMSETLKPEVSITRHTEGASNCDPSCSLISEPNCVGDFNEINGLISVESDDGSEGIDELGDPKYNETGVHDNLMDESEFNSRFTYNSIDNSRNSLGCNQFDNEANDLEPMDQILKQQDSDGCLLKDEKKANESKKPKRISKEMKIRLMEEKKQLKEQEKLSKAATKAQAAEMKKLKKEMQKWEKGKYALKSIVAEIDKKVIEMGSIGGHLLTRFAEKGLTYKVTTNPVERTIVWTMVIPEEMSEIASEQIKISYVLVVYEAEEFCNLVVNESLVEHIHNVRYHYPHHTICYLTNRLMAYINKMEQARYKNPANHAGWQRPPIEEVLAKLATHFFKVHTRQCVDEAELAEHVVGLTSSLASCHFRKKLTRLSVCANGLIIPKDCVDKNLIKKNLWLRALVAIPKVQPRFAISVWKKYPTMKSLLSVYMDPTKSVHEKEFLLKDLSTEGLVGEDRRVGEVCSKRIYRIVMAQCGNTNTDDVENGADFFFTHHQSQSQSQSQ
ncbi:crossover junction endonuclease EME1B-like [Andrographis paniculata]|uniref:crossover junction endonuclease EME1B-like n=1 Tax=Andrographis paniculata TaxID=175694 RepID=UPI0021E90930|nr:crossover junction endonuclease EME1B-like [Andrographis paniculata]